MSMLKVNAAVLLRFVLHSNQQLVECCSFERIEIEVEIEIEIKFDSRHSTFDFGL